MNQLTLGFEAGARTTGRKSRNAIACCEEPQHRLEQFGAAALSDTELLAIQLGGTMARSEASDLASRLIAEAGSIAGLASWHATDFRRVAGIGRGKSRQLATLMEISRRVIRGPDSLAPLLDRPEKVAALLKGGALGLEVEKFWVLCLNRKGYLLKQIELTSGTATQTLASPRSVYRAAVREGATAITVAHNHPSGFPEPSTADISITRQLKDAGHALEIPLHDHLILGRPECDPLGRGFFSFRERALI